MTSKNCQFLANLNLSIVAKLNYEREHDQALYNLNKLHQFSDFEHNISLYFRHLAQSYCQNADFKFEFVQKNMGPQFFPHTLSAIFSSIVNSMVIFLSVFGLKKDFRFFFANLALADTLFAIGRFWALYFYPFSVHYVGHISPTNLYECTLAYTIPIVLGAAGIFATFTTSLHRFNVIVRRNGQYFTKRKIAEICLLCYTPVLWPAYLLIRRDKIIHDYYTACKYRFHSNFVGLKLFVLPIALVIILHAYFLARLKFYLSKNMNELAVRLNKPVEEVKSENQNEAFFQESFTLCS